MRKIKLQTCDNELFEVDYDTLIKCSSTFRDMAEKLGVDEQITLPNIGSVIFRKFMEWVEHHKDDPILSDYQIIERRKEEISSWDADFLNMDEKELLELILVADYLGINGALLEISCEKLASLIEDRTSEEVRKAFDIENDFTPEEEEEIRRENVLDEER